MDLSIYSKSLEDYKNSILEVLDKAYSINTEYFYKPNISNKTELSRMWGDEYSLSEPIKQFRQEGTKEYLEDKLSEIFSICKVTYTDKPYNFSIDLEAREKANKEQLAKLNNYIQKYKNTRSQCDKINIKQATELNIKLASFVCLGKTISVYPKQPKDIVIGGGLDSAIAVHIINKQEIRNVWDTNHQKRSRAISKSFKW